MLLISLSEYDAESPFGLRTSDPSIPGLQAGYLARRLCVVKAATVYAPLCSGAYVRSTIGSVTVKLTPYWLMAMLAVPATAGELDGEGVGAEVAADDVLAEEASGAGWEAWSCLT
jgi:hypothetical protein